MSATLLSAFYDIDLFCKTEKALNNLNLSSMLDKKAVGSPVSSPNSSFIPGFLRRHSTSNFQTLTSNSVKFSNNNNNAFSNLKESSATTALLNKENKFRDRSFSENGERSQQLFNLQQQKSGAQINSTRYKTELCRPFEESGSCKYGEKCQFAHGFHELRSLTRHPKYKTELCRTFHTIGFCPYGPRCHFIHNAEERRLAPGGTSDSRVQPRDGLSLHQSRPKLHHSLSFSGFPNHHLDSPLMESPTSRTPPPQGSNSLYCEELLSPDMLSCANNAFTFSGPLQTANLSGVLCPATNNNPAYYKQQQPPSPPPLNFQPLRRLSESPVFDAPPSPPESISDRESYLSGSLSSGSLSGSDSPTLDSNRRLPIFSRLSISDD
ncbi:mRNA decay activator protein ZFP36L2 [Discoglossus pictus]